MERVPCYYMPKFFLTNSTLKKYSLDSKLLAGILLSSANTSETVIETANLIKNLTNSQIDNIISELRSETSEGNV